MKLIIKVEGDLSESELKMLVGCIREIDKNKPSRKIFTLIDSDKIRNTSANELKLLFKRILPKQKGRKTTIEILPKE